MLALATVETRPGLLRLWYLSRAPILGLNYLGDTKRYAYFVVSKLFKFLSLTLPDLNALIGSATLPEFAIIF